MTVLNYHRPLIYTRATWAAGWTERTTLRAISAVTCIAPEVSKALVRQSYGNKMQEGATAFAVEAPLDLRDHYIKIACASPAYAWYGVVMQQGTNILGATASDPTGIQEFSCFGLEHLLDRVVIDKGYVRLGANSFSTVGYCPAFNSRNTRTGEVVGNRHDNDNATVGGTPEGTGVYRFSGIDGNLWTNLDILRYLVHFFAPGPTGLFWLTGQYSDLAQITEVHELDGLTLREALNKVIDRRLGYGWCIRVSESPNTGAGIHIFSLFASDVTAGALTFNANSETWAPDVSTAADVKSSVVLRDRSQIYDSVRVRGARIKSTFTLSASDFVPGWTSTQEDAYRAGASGDGGYAALAWPEKVKANDLRRAGDDLASVYSLFILNRAWSWLVYQPPGTQVLTQAAPVCGDDGELTFTAPQPYDGPRAFLANLPLEEGRDYSITGFTSGAPAAAEVAFRRPFVLLADGTGAYHYADDVGTPDIPDAQVSPERNEMALRVRFRPAHIMALNQWPPAVGGPYADPAPSQYVPIYDWETLIATVCVETDQNLQVVATASGSPLAEYRRTLVLDVPDAELWYVADGTVVGIDGAGVVERVYNAYPVGDPLWTPILLRDDRDHLRSLAALAAQWYGVEHVAAHIEVTQLDNYASPGYLVTTVTGGVAQVFTVNSVVSRQSWDFIRGVTEIDTGWWDVDWQRVAPVDKYRMPDQKSLLRYVDTLDRQFRETKGAFA